MDAFVWRLLNHLYVEQTLRQEQKYVSGHLRFGAEEADMVRRGFYLAKKTITQAPISTDREKRQGNPTLQTCHVRNSLGVRSKQTVRPTRPHSPVCSDAWCLRKRTTWPLPERVRSTHNTHVEEGSWEIFMCDYTSVLQACAGHATSMETGRLHT